MSTHQNEATDNAHSSRPADHQKRGTLGGMGDKLAGVGNIAHGTGEIIRGHALQAGERTHGDGKAVAAAGRKEVERGLDKLEGKPIGTSAAHHPSNQGGARDGTGTAAAATGPGRTATALAPHPDTTSTSQTGREGAVAAGYPADKRTANAAEDETWDRRPERDDQAARSVPPLPGRAPAGDGPNVQGDTDVRQQGPGIPSGDHDKPSRTVVADAPHSNDVAGKEPPGTAAQTGNNAAAAGPRQEVGT